MFNLQESKLLNYKDILCLPKMLEIETLPLLNGDQIPCHIREVAIKSGYRPPNSSIKQCIQSVFILTNETLNVWTHFIPGLYFCWKLGVLYDTLNIASNPYTWAFTAYMITACIYPFISAMAHTFYCVSDLARDACFFFDYAALSLYGFGTGLLYRSYVFPHSLLKTVLADYFIEIGVALSILSTIMACSSRFMEKLLWIKLFRLGAFAVPWIWDSIPLIYRLYTNEYPGDPSTEHYLRQFVFSFLIFFFYATHLPERLSPGKFDFFGHSHQLLHICAIIATYEQMNGALYDLISRRTEFETNGFMVSPYWSISVSAIVLITNVLIICYFIWLIFKKEKLKKS